MSLRLCVLRRVGVQQSPDGADREPPDDRDENVDEKHCRAPLLPGEVSGTGQQEHREHQQEVAQAVVQAAFGREVPAHGRRDPPLGFGPGHDRCDDHRIGRGDRRTDGRGHQQGEPEQSDRARCDDEHQGHPERDAEHDPAPP